MKRVKIFILGTILGKILHQLKTVKQVKETKIFLYISGFAALLWFLFRVIPKPQRASYPCQQAAFPIASAFVIWVTGTLFSQKLFVSAKKAFGVRSYSRSLILYFTGLVLFFSSVFFIQIYRTGAMAISFSDQKARAESLYSKVSEVDENIIDAKATIAIVQSEKSLASEIEYIDIETMIREAVTLAGGFDTLVKEGDTVVLKPNVISSHDQIPGRFNNFPEEANGVATDYRVIQAVVNLIRERTKTVTIYLLEGSGVASTRVNMQILGYNKITGLDSIIYLDETIGDWEETGADDIVEVNLPEGKFLYSSANKYYLHKIYKNAQVLISLPCLKSHFVSGITGSIKNIGIGATPTKIYGNGPGNSSDDITGRWNHINHGDFQTQCVSLDKWIHDFYLCRPIDYVIMDGLQGLEKGPFPGCQGLNRNQLASYQKNMRIILAGKDPLALDAIEANIMGFDPYLVGHLQYLANDNAGCINSAFIKVKGKQVHEIKTDFKEDMPGRKCKTTDFSAPGLSNATPCTISGNILTMQMAPDEEVVKIEVAYNDTILEPIVVGSFSNIQFPLKSTQTDIEKVTVYAYDKYLNCTVAKPAQVFTGLASVLPTQLSLYPNPASTTLYLEISDVCSSRNKIEIFTTEGKLVLRKQANFSEEACPLEIEYLLPGKYFVKITTSTKNYTRAFIKL